jgi:hypothetical protein
MNFVHQHGVLLLNLFTRGTADTLYRNTTFCSKCAECTGSESQFTIKSKIGETKAKREANSGISAYAPGRHHRCQAAAHRGLTIVKLAIERELCRISLDEIDPERKTIREENFHKLRTGRSNEILPIWKHFDKEIIRARFILQSLLQERGVESEDAIGFQIAPDVWILTDHVTTKRGNQLSAPQLDCTIQGIEGWGNSFFQSQKEVVELKSEYGRRYLKHPMSTRRERPYQVRPIDSNARSRLTSHYIGVLHMTKRDVVKDDYCVKALCLLNDFYVTDMFDDEQDEVDQESDSEEDIYDDYAYRVKYDDPVEAMERYMDETDDREKAQRGRRAMRDQRNLERRMEHQNNKQRQRRDSLGDSTILHAVNAAVQTVLDDEEQDDPTKRVKMKQAERILERTAGNDDDRIESISEVIAATAAVMDDDRQSLIQFERIPNEDELTTHNVEVHNANHSRGEAQILDDGCESLATTERIAVEAVIADMEVATNSGTEGRILHIDIPMLRPK